MFHNLGHGGDATHNNNYGMYGQNALIVSSPGNAVIGAGRTALRPAEHMSPATYNIWRHLNFGKERFPTNLGVREYINRLYEGGSGFAVGDIIGLSTLPHLAVVRGVMLRVNVPQEATSFDVVRVSTGEVLISNVDASVAGVHFVETTGFIVAADTNDSIGIRIDAWKPIDASNQDPCGVYKPCDDFTLCITLDTFFWSPVAADFCAADPCLNATAHRPYVAGALVADRLDLTEAAPVNSTTVIADSTTVIPDI